MNLTARTRLADPVPRLRSVDRSPLALQHVTASLSVSDLDTEWQLQEILPKHTPNFASALSAQRDSDPLVQCRASAIHPHFREDFGVPDWS